MATTDSDDESDDGRRVVGEPPGCAGDRVPDCDGGPHRNVPVDSSAAGDDEIQAVVDQYERVLDARDRERSPHGRSVASGRERESSDSRDDGVRSKIRGWVSTVF